MTQKMISFEIDKKLKLLLEQSLSVKRDKARLASLGLPHAGDWLNVISSPSGTLCSIGWELPSSSPMQPALPAGRTVTSLGTML